MASPSSRPLFAISGSFSSSLYDFNWYKINRADHLHSRIIPVALNVDYDVRRLNRVYSRRSFAEVLSLGDVESQDDEQDLAEAIQTISELQGQAVLPGIAVD